MHVEGGQRQAHNFWQHSWWLESNTLGMIPERVAVKTPRVMPQVRTCTVLSAEQKVTLASSREGRTKERKDEDKDELCPWTYKYVVRTR